MNRKSSGRKGHNVGPLNAQQIAERLPVLETQLAHFEKQAREAPDSKTRARANSNAAAVRKQITQMKAQLRKL